jgi:hypothetical protein
MSPSHHVRQTRPKSPEAISSPIRRLVTPIVALTVVLMMPARTTRANTSLTRSSEAWKSTRLSRKAPTSASNVLPVVIPSVTYSGTSVQAFARKAPSATPGHIR